MARKPATTHDAVSLDVLILAEGTGRFAFIAGILAMSIGIGAGISDVLAGYLFQSYGAFVCFASLGAIALAALTANSLPFLKDRLKPNRARGRLQRASQASF